MKRARPGRSLLAALLVFALLSSFLLLPALAPRLATAVEHSRDALVSLQPAEVRPPWQPNGLEAAWQRAREAGGYEFSTDIAQVTIPAATVGNVGREAEETGLRIEGKTDLRAETMEMTLWSQGGSVLDADSGISIRVEDGRTLARQGDGPWEEVGDVATLFAPDGDMLAYLAAARDISEGIEEVRGEKRITRYTFQVDGPRFAAYMRDQLQQQMTARGELPAGLELALPEVYLGMTGAGELWVGEDGLPVRQIVSLKFPDQEQGRVEAEITVDFAFSIEARTAAAAVAADASPASVAGRTWKELAGRVEPGELGRLAAAVALAGLFLRIVTRYGRSKKLYASLAVSVALSLVVAPLLQTHRAYAFSVRQEARAEEQAARQEESEMERTLQRLRNDREEVALAGPEALGAIESDDGRDSDSDGLTDVQELFLGTSPHDARSLDPAQTDARFLQAAGVIPGALQTDDGTDSDGDGLTDYQEQLLGTSSVATDMDLDGLYDGVDTDGDGISDRDEVIGFEHNGQTWYADALKADTNDDGIDDGREWKRPDTPHNSWDTDGDGVPDLFDEDNDGDGVPDHLDLSPFKRSEDSFGDANPFGVTIEGLNPGKPVYLEFQLRPTNPDHLQYSFNVLDWPLDKTGQMRDMDGATFADIDPALDPSPNANGDMKLVPMLEIRIPSAPSNLPLRATPPVLTLDLKDMTNSGLGGQAHVSQQGSDLRVQFTDGAYKPAALFAGTCDSLGQRVDSSFSTTNSQGVIFFRGRSLAGVADGAHSILLYDVGVTPPHPGSKYACATIPALPREGNQWIDVDLLNHYNIIVRSLGGERKAVYVPLQLVSDKGNRPVAFAGKMLYRPGTDFWGAAQEVRLVWLIQALVDTSDGRNIPQVLQTYYTDWTLAGLNVREDHGTDIGVIYEDPAVDGNLNRDDALMLLSHGLEQSFLAGRDCDTTTDTGACVGDGELDFSIAEIARRFDRASNGDVSEEERWNIENTLRVHSYSYAHLDEAQADVTSNRTQAILNDVFSPVWSAANPVSPTLMFAREERFRSLNLDAGLDTSASNVAWEGDTLALNLRDVEQLTMAALSVTPYRYDGVAWQNYPIADYWDELGRRHAHDFDDELASGESDQELVDGKLVFARLYYLALYHGASSLVKLGDVPLPAPNAKPDLPLGLKLFKYGGLGVKFLANVVFVLMSQGIEPSLTLRYLSAYAKQAVPGSSILLKIGKFFAPTKANWANWKGGVGRGAILVVVVLVVVALAALTGFFLSQYFGGQKWAAVTMDVILTGIQVFVALGLPIIGIIKATVALTSGAGAVAKAISAAKSFFTILSGGADMIKCSLGGAIIGLVIQVSVIWGLFFYQWISGAIQADTIAFNQALAYSIAATLLAVVGFALSLTVAGLILVGIVGAIDAILALLCNTFDVKGACWSISGAITEFVANQFYGVQPTLDLKRDNLVEVTGLDLKLGDPDRGYVAGNWVQASATVRTNLYQALLGSPADQARLVYHAGEYLSADKLRSSTFQYRLNSAPPASSRNEMRSAWRDVGVFARMIAYVPYPLGIQDQVPFDLYSGWASGQAWSNPVMLDAGINESIPLRLHYSYALPAAECWGTRALSSCKDRTVSGSGSGSDLGLVVDVLPATLDAFYALDWATIIGLDWSSGVPKAVTVNLFGTQRDHDGDGLIAKARGGLDPDDTRWDTDGDGLSDGYELELRSGGLAISPENPDIDGDGLNDGEEIRLGTDPTSADGDGDGLTDKEEIEGWLFQYAPGKQTRVTSDPTNPDTDGDSLLDRLERELHGSDPVLYPYHPRVANESLARLAVDVGDTDGFVSPGSSFAYTATVSNEAEEPPLKLMGTLTTTLPAAMGGRTDTRAVTVLPGEELAHAIDVEVSSSATTQRVTLISELAADLFRLEDGSSSLGGVALSQATSLVVDSDPPDSSVSSFADAGHLKAGALVNIGGSASDPTSGIAHVDVRLDDGEWERATGAESWAYGLQVPASEGLHRLSTRATDVVGNVQSPRETTFIADARPPGPTSEIAPNSVLSATRNADGRWVIELSGTVNDPLAGGHAGSGVQAVEVMVAPHDAGWQTAVLTGSSQTSWEIGYVLNAVTDDGSALLDATGTYTVAVRAIDRVANQTAEADYLQFPIRIDSTPPTADVHYPTVGSTLVTTETVVLNDIAASAITETVSMSGTVVDPGTIRTGVRSLDAALVSADLGVAPGIWRGWYHNNTNATGGPVLVRADEDIDFQWGSGAPGPGVNADNFSVVWTRDTVFRVPGRYRFSLTKDSGATADVYLDDALALSVPAGTGSKEVTLEVSGGLHTVRVVYAHPSGGSHITFGVELAEATWQPAILAQSGSGVLTTTWAYTIPEGIEGIYQLDLRGTDVLNNVNSDRSTYGKWRGEIDTASPRVHLDVDYVGIGSAARTVYQVWANDFNLTEEGLVSPCSVESADRYYYDTDWWRDWFSGSARLYQIHSTCSVSGHQTEIPPVTACDIYGRCTTVDPDAPEPPNTRALYWKHWPGPTNNWQEIRRIDLTSGTVETAVRNDVGYGRDPAIDEIAIDTNSGYVYWSAFASINPHGYAGAIWRANLDGSNKQLVWQNTYNPATNCCIPPETMDYRPEEIVFDPATNRIYWARNQIVYRVDADGTNFITATLPFDVDPDIAIDPSERILFLSSAEYPLYRVYFVDADTLAPTGGWIGDSNPDQIQNGFWNIDDLVADPLGRQLFLVRNGGEIRRVPYPDDFSAQTEPFTNTIFYDDGQWYRKLAIDPPGEKLYFGTDNVSSLKRMNLDGTSVETVVVATGQFPPGDLALDVNYHPEAEDLVISTRKDTPVSFELKASDPNINPLAYTLATPPAGMVSGMPSSRTATPPTITYTPPPGYTGPDRFTYQVNDGRGGTAEATVSIQVRPTVDVDSTVLTPDDGSVITSRGPIVVRVGVRTTEGLKDLELLASGSHVETKSWAPNPSITDVVATFEWTPQAEGPYTLTTVATDHDGNRQVDLHPVQVIVDWETPSISIVPTVLTTTHQLASPTLIPFAGTATDSAGVRTVEVRVGDGPWQTAVIEGTSWTLNWNAPSSPDGATYTVTARATDGAGRTADVTESVVVDFGAPTPVSVTLSAQDSASGDWSPIAIGATVRELNTRLRIEWTESSDGSGIAGYYAGWTETPTPTLAALTAYGAAGRHDGDVREGQVLYAHLGIADSRGNVRWQSAGPIYVDAPTTPDMVGPGRYETGAYHGWMESGASQIGADREASRYAGRPVQRFYATWNETDLRLSWTGADWDRDGDLFVYLDTKPGGARTAYNPYATPVTIGLPAKNGRPLEADYLIWVVGAHTATLLRWDGSAWVEPAALGSDRFRFDNSRDPVQTDLTLPFSTLGLTAGSALKLVAFATEEGALRLWAAMPDKNPLNSALVVNPVAPADRLTDFTLTQQYEWPSLGSGVRPNAGQFADSDLQVTIGSRPGALAAGYLESDLLHLLAPDRPLDGDLDGRPNSDLPLAQKPAPLGRGQTVTYTLVYENRGTEVAPEVEVAVTLRGALEFAPGVTAKTFSLGDVPAGAVTNTLEFAATVKDAPATDGAEVSVVVADGTHDAFEWLWVHHAVDRDPPTTPVINSPAGYAPPGAVPVVGEASDPSGIGAIELEVTPLAGGPSSAVVCTYSEPGNGVWRCEWNAGDGDGQYRLRARARDPFGNQSGWSEPVTATVDATAPTVRLDAASRSLLEGQAHRPGKVRLRGEVLDNDRAHALEMCSAEEIDFSCLRTPARPGSTPTGSWELDLPIFSTGDGITRTVTFYGLDAAGNRSTAPLSQTYRIDTVAPVVTVTTALTDVFLDDYLAGGGGTAAPVLSGTVGDGGGIRELGVRMVMPDGDTRFDPIAVDQSTVGEQPWQYVPRLDAVGTYTLTVEAEDHGGNRTTDGPFTLLVDHHPVEGLTITNDSPTTLGQITTLTATITAGRNVSYTWDLGDQTIREGAVVTHTYARVGSYSVVVTAVNPAGTVTAAGVVTITDVPIRGLVARNDSPTIIGSETALTATIETGSNVVYEWDFGDGSSADGANVGHRYGAVGIYTATVTASNGTSVVSTTTPVTVTDVPIAGLSAANDGPTALGEATTLTATVTAGDNVDYSWSFGDGASGRGRVVTHTYQSPGRYTARVTATNTANVKSAATIVTVDEIIGGLKAASDGPTALGSATTLTATIAAGSNTTYRWDFGDGTSGNGAVVTHTYPAVGVYTATVTATNSVGVLTATTTITIDETIAGLGAVNDGPTALGSTTLFTATVTNGSNVTYTWDFGDGASGSGAVVTHSYPAVGVYTATVTATNSVGVLTATTTVTVDEIIGGLQAANDGPTALGSATTLTATITAGSSVTYTWDLGDGSVASGPVVTHTYPAVGNYTAVVTATNSVSVVTEMTTITVDETISGLGVVNDGPTALGAATWFTATVTSGSNVTYTWDFGDGRLEQGFWQVPVVPRTISALPSNTFVVSHTYPAVGRYTAIFTATNHVSTMAVTDTVIVDEALAGLSAANDGPTSLGAATTLTATIAAGSNVDYVWDFGDGTSGSGAVVTHTYPAVGVYAAVATATNSVGVLTATTTVTVDQPIAGLAVATNAPTALGATTWFTATVTSGSNVTYTWDFGDGDRHQGLWLAPEQAVGASAVPSNTFVVSHTYTAFGRYTAMFTATNEVSTGVVTNTVVIDEALAGLSAANDGPATVGEQVTFSATVTAGSNVTYTWDFGDGAAGIGAVATHAYRAAGTYTATVTATNSVGVLTATTTVIVSEPPPEIRSLFLPIVQRKTMPRRPDLIVEEVRLDAGGLSVVVKNQGDAAVSSDEVFWVDLYIDPDPPPTGVNQVWEMLGEEGLVWGVTESALPLAHGETLTLTVGDEYYRPELSRLAGPLSAGRVIYVQVDSANSRTEYGGVLESHEANGGAYNNVSGPVTVPAELRLESDGRASALPGDGAIRRRLYLPFITQPGGVPRVPGMPARPIVEGTRREPGGRR